MNSLQGRLIASATGIMLASGLFAGLGGYHAARTEADEILDAQLAQVAQTLLFIVQDQAFDTAGDIGQGIRHDHSLIVYQVWQLKPGPGQGGTIHWSRRDRATAPAYPRLVLRSGDQGWPSASVPGGYSTLPVSGREFRFLARDSNDHAYRVEVGERLIDSEEMVRQIAWNNTWPYLAVLPLGLALLVWSLHRGLAPLRRLASELGTRHPEHLEGLTIEGLPRELEPVLNALNALLGRLHQALENERRFTGDAAHELRTPMAGLRAQLDALRLAPDKDTRMQAERQTSHSLARMTRLVDQLLLLARLDAAPPPTTQLDAEPIAGGACRELAPTALARGIDLALLAEPALLNCDEEDLRILLRNLIDNAIRYGRPGDRIEVHVGRAAGQVRLAVLDSGPGLAPEQRRGLGCRFQRLGRSDPEGSGLGLSIVARVAERYGASLAFGTGLEGRGLGVVVTFPVPE
ncbi:MAG: ATP-binding protein [Pseudomonadota bacterium]